MLVGDGSPRRWGSGRPVPYRPSGPGQSETEILQRLEGGLQLRLGADGSQRVPGLSDQSRLEASDCMQRTSLQLESACMFEPINPPAAQVVALG